MVMIKCAAGGVVGSAVGAYLANLVQPMLQVSLAWPMILSGIFAGLLVRMLAGHQRSFSTGFVAAVACLLGIAIVTIASSTLAQNKGAEYAAPLPTAAKLGQGDLTEANLERVDQNYLKKGVEPDAPTIEDASQIDDAAESTETAEKTEEVSTEKPEPSADQGAGDQASSTVSADDAVNPNDLDQDSAKMIDSSNKAHDDPGGDDLDQASIDKESPPNGSKSVGDHEFKSSAELSAITRGAKQPRPATTYLDMAFQLAAAMVAFVLGVGRENSEVSGNEHIES